MKAGFSTIDHRAAISEQRMVKTPSRRVWAAGLPTNLAAAVDGRLPCPRSQYGCVSSCRRGIVVARRHRAGARRGLRPQRPDAGPEIILCRTWSLPKSDRTMLGRFPLTTVTVLIDLGAVVDEELLEIAFECAYRRGLTDPQRAWRRLRSCAGRGSRGPAQLRKILDVRGTSQPAGSVLEVKFIRLTRRGHLPPFERQWKVFDRKWPCGTNRLRLSQSAHGR
jgi:hypothetical protein